MSYQDKCVGGNCVSEVIEDIILAQKEVSDESSAGGGCRTGCDRSIKDLLSPGMSNNGPLYTTIPFILYCAGTCSPFFGTGIYKSNNMGEGNNRYLNCVESPIFRAKNFVEGSTNCVRLELLLPATEDGMAPCTNDDGGKGSVCSYFPNDTVSKFQATGICITVDLNQFYGITCLDPVIPFSPANFA